MEFREVYARQETSENFDKIWQIVWVSQGILHILCIRSAQVGVEVLFFFFQNKSYKVRPNKTSKYQSGRMVTNIKATKESRRSYLGQLVCWDHHIWRTRAAMRHL